MAFAIIRPFFRMFNNKPLAIGPTIKWELANKIANQAEIPEEIVAALFKKTFDNLERTENKQYSPSFREKAWHQLGPSSVWLVRVRLRQNIIEKVLPHLTHQEAEEVFSLMDGNNTADRNAWLKLTFCSLHANESIQSSLFDTAVSCSKNWEARLKNELN